ncbi:formyltransferase family protein [Kitasatospora sp. GAS1066B]
MIFVGRGALLRRAVEFALTNGHCIDMVCSDDPKDAGREAAAGACQHVPDINAQAHWIVERCTDGIVWSINNRTIFGPALVDSGLRIYNIHNGLLPQHRGLPSVAVIFALLHGHPEYGATLHEVDRGIDTGRVLAEERFPLPPDARYHDVVLRGVQQCHHLFEASLSAIVAGRDIADAPDTSAGRQPGYYGLHALRELDRYRGHPAFARATDLGPLAPYLPEVLAALARIP